jgi:site-specific recombinase XerD
MMSIIARAGSPVWNYEFEIAGQRYRKPTPYGLDDPRDPKRRGKNYQRAVEFEGGEKTKIRGMLAQGLSPQTGKPTDITKELPIGPTFDEYYESNGRNFASADNIKAHLNRLATYFATKGIRSLYDISDPEIEDLVQWRRQHTRWDRPGERKLSAAAVNRSTVQVLRLVFSWVKTKKRGLDKQKIRFPNEPEWKSHVLAEPRERVRELREDESGALTAAEHDPDYQAWREFSLRSGLRLKNSLLRWRDVDLRKGHESVTVIAKGNEVKTLPLSPEAVRILRTRQGHHPEWCFTFVARRTWAHPQTGRRYVKGRRYPITYRGAQSHWYDLRGRAAKDAPSLIDPTGRLSYRLHDNRHDLGTKLLRATGNLKAVKGVLGHASIQTSAKYAHALDNDLREALAATEAHQAPAAVRRKAAVGESPQ